MGDHGPAARQASPTHDLPQAERHLEYVPALDGVRGLAVLAVLAFHGGMPWARGGFLGVEAFFVLSGFLITSLLLTEWATTGHLALGRFWGRRARRLLPALLLVIVVVMFGARTLLPPEEVRLLRGDGLSALLYVANWRMILRGGDYFAQTASPSPLEHTWSLGIEEQFYVVWPLLVAAALAMTMLGRTRRSALTLAFAMCVLGVAASTLALAALHQPDDPGRAYYGTDTRGASLLVGAGLAVLVARLGLRSGRGHRLRSSRSARTALGAAAATATLALAWAWTHVDGGDVRLYRGGLLLLALAVATVLAHVVLIPTGWSARALAVTPLVLVGRISYGVYLWHWPIFLAVNGQRTGYQGLELFLLRCLVTFAVATLSFVMVERPIRRGALLRLRRVPARAALASACVAVVAGLILVTTAVRVPEPTGGLLVADRAPAMREARQTSVVATGPRATGVTGHGVHRHPLDRRRPTVHVYGDSVAWSLVKYLPPSPDLQIRGRTFLGCGLARLGPYRYAGVTYPGVGPDCRSWPRLWRASIEADDPDVAVVLVGRWETMDRELDGRWTHVGEPDLDTYLRSELELAIRTLGSHGARVVLATEPYNRRWETLDGGLYPEDEPERVRAWNALLRDVAADHPEVELLDFGARVSPEGQFTWTAGGVTVRSDGLHLTPEGVQQWIAPWLLPQLKAVVRDMRAEARPGGATGQP